MLKPASSQGYWLLQLNGYQHETRNIDYDQQTFRNVLFVFERLVFNL